MSHLHEMRDVDPVERGGQDEWGACCWWQGTRICACVRRKTGAEPTGPTAAEINNPPREHIERWETRK